MVFRIFSSGGGVRTPKNTFTRIFTGKRGREDEGILKLLPSPPGGRRNDGVLR